MECSPRVRRLRAEQGFNKDGIEYRTLNDEPFVFQASILQTLNSEPFGKPWQYYIYIYNSNAEAPEHPQQVPCKTLRRKALKPQQKPNKNPCKIQPCNITRKPSETFAETLQNRNKNPLLGFSDLRCRESL